MNPQTYFIYIFPVPPSHLTVRLFGGWQQASDPLGEGDVGDEGEAGGGLVPRGALAKVHLNSATN